MERTYFLQWPCNSDWALTSRDRALPTVNATSDVKATCGLLSQMTLPLAEAGYYVVPVAPMEETFKYNGLTTPTDIQGVTPAKLRDILGADAALYTKVKQYGCVYTVLDSKTVVAASAKLVNLKIGDVLCQGEGRATGDEVGNNVNEDSTIYACLTRMSRQ